MQCVLPMLRGVLAALVLGWMVTAGMAAEPVAPASPAEWEKMRAETFEVVWGTVNETYFDPAFGGVDWKAVGDKYRRQLDGAADKAALRKLLQRMLGELRRTHFAILPREASVFSAAERTRVGTVGAAVSRAKEGVAISQLAEDSAARRAGLQTGETIVRVDDVELAALEQRLKQADVTDERRGLYLTQLVENRLHGAVGGTARLVVRDRDGAERAVQLTFEEYKGEWSDAVGNLPASHLKVRASCSPEGIAYLNFNVFTRQAMKDIRALLRAIPPQGGLILDLRGNSGGLTVMASGITGWLSDRSFLMGTMQMRQGHIGFTVAPQRHAFLGPVAVLIDASSASTSEIMAGGLQEAGRARLFGERTPGAALPSLFKKLPTEDLLQYAVADLQTPSGKLIEGRGITPDEIVIRTAADLAAGRDPVREAAENWLNVERYKSPRVNGTSTP